MNGRANPTFHSNKSRLFSTTPSRTQDDDNFSVFEKALLRRGSTSRPFPLPSSSNRFNNSNNSNNNNNTFSSPSSPAEPPASSPDNSSSSSLASLVQTAHAEASTRPSSLISDREPYHLTVYTHKHNIHITFTEPSRNPILSFSAGNIGLRKAQRGSFDAAYQLSTYTMRKMAEKQWRLGGKQMTANKMLTLSEKEVRDKGIEVVLRGYGPGREAFVKALQGTEGRMIKPLVKRVTDATRLKFGGTRSPQVRRLG